VSEILADRLHLHFAKTLSDILSPSSSSSSSTTTTAASSPSGPRGRTPQIDAKKPDDGACLQSLKYHHPPRSKKLSCHVDDTNGLV
jgi:hypothetical protein